MVQAAEKRWPNVWIKLKQLVIRDRDDLTVALNRYKVNKLKRVLIRLIENADTDR